MEHNRVLALGFFDGIIGNAASDAVFEYEMGRTEGGDQPRALLQHGVDDLIIEIDAVLDAVDTGFEGIADTAVALGVGADPCALLVGLFDDNGHLFDRQLLGARLDTLCHDAAGGHDLYPVRPCPQHLPGGLAAVIPAVGLTSGAPAVTAGHADAFAGSLHVGAVDLAGRDGIAQDESRELYPGAGAHHAAGAGVRRSA